jgi:hypothetical protein
VLRINTSLVALDVTGNAIGLAGYTALRELTKAKIANRKPFSCEAFGYVFDGTSIPGPADKRLQDRQKFKQAAGVRRA